MVERQAGSVKAGKQRHHAVSISGQRPGENRQHLAGGGQQRACNGAEARQHQQRRLRRQYQRIGQQRGKRDAPKMPGNDRQGRQLRGQRIEEVFAERRGDLVRLVFRQAFLQQLHRLLVQWFGEEHQPQRGSEGELETHIPGQRGVEHAHERSGEPQRVDPGLPAPDEVTTKGADRHQRRPHHRGCAAHEDRVQGDEQRGKRRRPVTVEQAVKDPHKKESQHRHIEPGDGDDMRCAGLLIGFFQALRQVLVQPQQDAREQP